MAMRARYPSSPFPTPDDRGVDAFVPHRRFEPGSDRVDAARDRLARSEELFAAALEQPGRSREAWLRAHCPDDPELVAEVLALIAADADAQADAPLWHSGGCLAELLSVSASTGGSDEDTAVPQLAPGDCVGVYRVVRLLGRGGMGAVHLAEREDVGARVALKVVRAVYARDVRAEERFLAERRALARLGHPHVARLLDAGIVQGGPADGAPWFAMEYVDGEPIDVACDRQRLGVRERLALVADVCGAVEAAHQQLVIHRDLKPSNVLVTAEGRAMLLDFGIAATLDTQADVSYAGGLLTPQYAAPEQVRGDPPSVSVDVYALGLLLFELVTGCRPYDVRGRTPATAAEAVLTARVPRPSDVVIVGDDARAHAAARATTPGALRRALRGDVDAIVARALARDAAKRYATVGALCADLRRVLAYQPVSARTTTGLAGVAYRTRRLVRRNRTAVAALLLVAATATAAGANYMRSAQVAAAERDRARDAAVRAGRVRDILVGLFESANPDSPVQTAPDRSAEALLRRGEALADALTDEPDVQADLLTALGDAWTGVGDLAASAREFRRVVDIRRAHLPPHDPLIADALDQLGSVLGMGDRMRAADSVMKQSLAIRREQVASARAGGAAGTPDSAAELALARTLVRQGRVQLEMGQCPAAIPNFQQAGMVFAQWRVPAPRVMHAVATTARVHWPAMAATLLGQCLQDKQDFVAAGGAYRAALALLEQQPSEFRLQYAKALNDYANYLTRVGRYEEAETVFRRTLALKRAMLPRVHPSIASTLAAFGAFLSTTGRYAAAESSYTESVAIGRATFGPVHRRVQVALLGLGLVRWQQANAAGAAAAFGEALALVHAGEPRPSMERRAAAGLGTALLALGRTEDAERLLRRAVVIETTQRDPVTGPEFIANIPREYEGREFAGPALRARWASALTRLGRPRDAARVRQGESLGL